MPPKTLGRKPAELEGQVRFVEAVHLEAGGAVIDAKDARALGVSVALVARLARDRHQQAYGDQRTQIAFARRGAVAVLEQGVEKTGRDPPLLGQPAGAEFKALDGEGVAVMTLHQTPDRLIELETAHDVLTLDEGTLCPA